MIRLLIADDHPVVRDGLSGMFASHPDFEVLGEAADGEEAVRRAQALKPDVVLMDLRMPGMDGVSAIRELVRRGVPARVLVLTTYDTDSDVLPAIEAGATGYLLKDAEAEEVAQAVRAAYAGETHLDPAVARLLARRMRERRSAPPPAEPLTHRELEVLSLVGRGASNKEIATALFITERTARTHVSNILGKLDLASRTQAALYAVENKLVNKPA
jgi:DNA-binding NarL/FixJ family response regulator